MINKIKDTIKKYGMLEKGDHVVVAISGGPDSVALLKVMEMISDEYGLTLTAAHINHGLRKESDQDEQFVRRISEEAGIKFECRKVDIGSQRKGTGKSIEEISRDVRYRFLNDVAKMHHAGKIALGHHLNDQVETVLMNFLRGSGAEGLKGMLPKRGLFIRPLLRISRKEIHGFLEARNIPFMTDTSNAESLYLRNRIRHLLIPELKAKFNPNLDASLSNMAEIMRLEDDYMKTVTREILSDWGIGQENDEIMIRISALAKYHEAIQYRIMKDLLRRLTPHTQGIAYAHIKAALDLCSADRPGGQLDFPYGILVRREYDTLVFSRSTKTERKAFYEKFDKLHYDVAIPGSVKIVESGKTIKFAFVEHPVRIKADERTTVYMDYDRIVFPVIIRTLKPGDRIQPLGMKGTKKIKSYFIDEKVPLNIRKEIPLLLDRESVIWITGMRLSERVKITDKTSRVLKVEIV